MNTHESKIFMHDGAPCHKVKVMTSYLKNEKVEVLLWPGNSLDINPTENFWKILKDDIAEKQPTSTKHLCEMIKLVWVAEITQALVYSMSSQIESVIENRGGHTKYWKAIGLLCFIMFIFKCSDGFLNVVVYFAHMKPNIVRISRIKKKQGGSKLLVMTVIYAKYKNGQF